MKRVRTSLFFVAVLGVLALGGSALGIESTEQIQGLISHWTFDEGTGSTAYDSAGGNDGTIYGAVWTSGQIDGALDFDGVDDYVDLGNDSSLKPPLPVTLSAWIRPSGSGDIMTFAALGDQAYAYYGIWFNVRPDNKLGISYGDGTAQASYARRTKNGTTPLSTGTWYHVTAVLRGPTDMELYVNGEDDGGTYAGTGGSLAYSGGSSRIGGHDFENEYFNGQVDDVRVYDKALSAEEIWQLYLPGAGPVSHWTFDEGQGSIAYDSAGGNDGTVYGAVWTTGQIDGALSFDGVDDYVSVPDNSTLDFTSGQNFSVAAWFSIEAGETSGQPILQKYSNQSGYALFGNSGSVSGRIAFVTWGTGQIFVLDDGGYNDGNWHHAVGVRSQSSGKIQLYINGVEVDTNNEPARSLANSANLRIGTNWTGNSDYHGKIDDVRIYDRALSAEEIQELYHGEIGNKASGPSPADEATNVNPNVVLSWSSGKDALSHDVYLGTDPNDVNEATPDSNEYMGNYAVNSYDPCGLDFNTTYCWRVDEVADPNTYYKGDVWSFTTWADPESCLISKWMFDEGEGPIAYDSAGTNHGLIQGAAWTTGQIDGALDFDGVDDYVIIADDDSLTVTDLTISAWIKNTGSGFQVILEQLTYIEGDTRGVYVDDDGTLHFFGCWSLPQDDDTNYNVRDNEWHHIAATRSDAQNQRAVYVDSAKVANLSDTQTGANNPTLNMYIGARGNANIHHFSGLIDEVAIYNRALSEEEILEVYRNGLCEPGYPYIKVWPETLEFSAEQGGPDPAPQTFSVSNFGDGILNYLITQDCTWLEVDPNAGSSTGEANEVTVSVDISGLTSGIHECNVIVYDPNASNNPKIVQVQLEIILLDCNGNLVPDPADITDGTSKDCNGNGIPDECDIAEGRSTDVNDDGIPDECQIDASVVPVAVLIDPARTSEVRTTLPDSVPGVVRGNTYYIEIWASDIGETNTGLTSVYVDVAFCDETSASVVEHGDIFVTFPDGAIQPGGVDEFGGSALPSGGGIEPEWVRIGWIQMSANVEETCTISLLPSSSGIGALDRGLIPWTFVELGSVDLQITPPVRSYDLDGDDFIGVGDLSLFAGSWQQHVPPADESHDFDCDNKVGVGDLSWFATGWQKNIDDPTILYPPCLPEAESMSMLNNDVPEMPNSNTSQTSFPTDIPESPSDIAFALAVLDSPSWSDTTTILPTSVKRISSGQTYYLELWVSDIGHINTGLTSAYVDLSFPDHAVSIVDISHSDIFTMFTSGSDFPGHIDELGGSTVDANGIEPDWARVAIVQMHADATLPFVTFTLSPSETEVAAIGRGIIPWNDISLGSLMICPANFNSDAGVDMKDFSIFASAWKTIPGHPQWNPDCDITAPIGYIDMSDLAWLVNSWLAGIEP